jgi:hypothetical protein
MIKEFHFGVRPQLLQHNTVRVLIRVQNLCPVGGRFGLIHVGPGQAVCSATVWTSCGITSDAFGRGRGSGHPQSW